MLVLLICTMSLFIVGLDSTIVNVALPAIGKDLHGGVSGLQWTIDAYTLVLASLLMLAGATADRVGRRRVFMTGLAVFTVGSGLCSLAPSLGALVAFRMVQAVGGSMLNPVAMSIITNTFTDRAERARAIGIWGASFGLSVALGPVIGGLLVDSVGWRGAFWVNIPVGLTAIVLTARFVPESRSPKPRRPDPIGQTLIVTMLGTITYAIIEGPGRGWTSPLIMTLFCVSAAALMILIVVEMRRLDPVIDPRFFRSAPFSGSVLTAICATGSLAGFLFLATLYLQDARGMSALMAGLHMLPMAVVMATGAVLSGRLLASRGARAPLVIAGLGLIVGALLLSRLTISSGTLFVLVAFAVLGIGSGLVNAPITQAAVSGMPASQAGVASGIASTSRQVGQSLGVAVTGSILAGRLHGGPLRTGFVAASQPAWFVMAGCGVVVFALGLITTGKWAMKTVAQTAALFSPTEGAHAVTPVIPPAGAPGAETGAGLRASQPGTYRRARGRPDSRSASKPSSRTPSP